MVYGPAQHELVPPTTEDDVENPAAWHPDPSGKHDHRWWDGQRWTEHVADAGVASVDPLPAAPDGAGGPGGATADEPGVELPTSDDAGDAGDGEAGEATAGDHDAGPSGTTDAVGTAGAAPTAEQPVWGQQAPHGQQAPPGQQPWGGAPAAETPWGQQPAWGPAPAPASQPSGLAIAALITGILSLPLLIAGGIGGIVAGIVAVVLGVLALRRASRGEAGGKGLAIGGIVTGAIGIVLGTFIAIFIFSVGVGVFEEMEACMRETGGDRAECERRLERELTDRFLGE